MQSRVDFVARHYDGFLCDVGIGSGAFIELRGNACGYDVCSAAIEWLRTRNLLVDPYRIAMPAISLWDVLEHIPEFWRLLRNVDQWLFVSLPIFTDARHALRSKHFRPDEHCWYWTRDGLVQMMRCLGFYLVEENDSETKLGREDIGSFAFTKGAG
jgi:Methyltransferase domain